MLYVIGFISITSDHTVQSTGSPARVTSSRTLCFSIGLRNKIIVSNLETFLNCFKYCEIADFVLGSLAAISRSVSNIEINSDASRELLKKVGKESDEIV